MKTKVFILAAMAACLAVLSSCKTEKDPMERVRDQVRQEYLTPANPAGAAELLASQQADGSWSDINYKDRSRATWAPTTHLSRIAVMSASYEKEKKDPAMYEGITKGLKYWYAVKPVSDNWWHNDIGWPQVMLNICWILDDDLPAEVKEDVFDALRKIDSDAGPGRPGGDRAKVIGDNARAAMYMRDWEEAAEQFRNLENEAHIANPEEIVRDLGGFSGAKNANPTTGRGIQPDMSLHHRNDGVDNTNTYGAAVVDQFSYWGAKLKGTQYELDSRAVQCIIDFFFEGTLKHTFKYVFNEPGSWNRDLSRPGVSKLAPRYAKGLKAICGGYREAELDDVIAIQSGEKTFDKSWCKFFWCSQYFIFQNPQYAASVRMHNKITMNIEYPYNGEAIHSHFHGDGSSHLSLEGNEYTGLQAVFDFTMFPGTTSLRVSEFPERPQLIGKSDFVGGVTDGKVGSAVFDFISGFYNLTARKSWFFFDKGYVCLGAGINSSEKEDVVTTLEQCNSAGDVKVEGNCAYNKGVLYESLDGSKLNCIDEELMGDFTNVVKGTTYDNRKDTARVFKLWFDHGVKPRDKSYAYAVIPGAGSTKAADLFKVLSNTKDLQAVESKDGKIAMFNFYVPGTAKWTRGEIEVNQPCALMVNDGKAYVSDPSRKLDRIYVTINGKRSLTPLPVWQHAGETQPVKQPAK